MKLDGSWAGWTWGHRCSQGVADGQEDGAEMRTREEGGQGPPSRGGDRTRPQVGWPVGEGARLSLGPATGAVPRVSVNNTTLGTGDPGSLGMSEQGRGDAPGGQGYWARPQEHPGRAPRESASGGASQHRPRLSGARHRRARGGVGPAVTPETRGIAEMRRRLPSRPKTPGAPLGHCPLIVSPPGAAELGAVAERLAPGRRCWGEEALDPV